MGHFITLNHVEPHEHYVYTILLHYATWDLMSHIPLWNVFYGTCVKRSIMERGTKKKPRRTAWTLACSILIHFLPQQTTNKQQNKNIFNLLLIISSLGGGVKTLKWQFWLTYWICLYIRNIRNINTSAQYFLYFPDGRF